MGACFGSVCGNWDWSSSGGNCEEHLSSKAYSLAHLYYLNDNNKNASFRSTYYKNNSEVQLDHIVSMDNRQSIDNNS